MSTVTVSTYSTDRELRATLAGRGDLSLEFRVGAYERSNETTLAHELSKLLEKLTSGQREGYRRRALAKGLRIDTEPHWDVSVRRFHERCDRMPVSWTSPTGAVTLSCRGLRDWTVALKPGSLRRLSEAEFCDEVRLAAAGVWWQHRRNLALLREKRRQAASAGQP